MGRAKTKVTDDGSSAYSVIRMPGFQMDLHKKQQNMIFSDLNASRQKLQEENQMLRDELAEAKMIIRLLKMKLDERDGKHNSTTATKDTSLAVPPVSCAAKAIDRSNKKKRYLFKSKTSSRRDAFVNPRPPGSKTFAVRRRSLSPPDAQRNISPRSTFSPILNELRRGELKKEEKRVIEGVATFTDSQIEDMAARLGRTSINNRSK